MLIIHGVVEVLIHYHALIQTWRVLTLSYCLEQIAMLLALLVHHVFSTVYAMFSASLLMHMLFACFATQVWWLHFSSIFVAYSSYIFFMSINQYWINCTFHVWLYYRYLFFIKSSDCLCKNSCVILSHEYTDSYVSYSQSVPLRKLHVASLFPKV